MQLEKIHGEADRHPKHMKELLKRLVVASVLIAETLNAAHAQCGGVNTGGRNCTPPTAPGMPGFPSDNQGTITPAPSYASQWGAIVIDGNTGDAGTVTGRSSKEEAIRDATSDCQSHGAEHCKVVSTYANKCAAIAWGTEATGSYGVASRDQIEDAKSVAMHECSEGYGRCKIVYSACSLPKQIR